ncbi:Lipid carrier : UDP-N-acetylgalactosaminyltransferase [Mariniradius saccharolyticus AK6]|uniref:Lipid carrier: UDP-N-acetylgalactosaminyltransferase n=1 Tax=Mariniradius saccharolyticus AK6 TaxID=1239962 RepID=M7XVB9_9BACT|nr:sugar transferase [Mariniradius saccharolyticus]EMS32427.1 Lipid carrier : UDP-N-acetylgalactosaminyltransferase [Mariniradius saccharolyticus AK6]
MYRGWGKRFLDVFLAGIMLILSAPIFIIATLALATINRGNPLFLQPRPGLHGKVFTLVKFKTMRDAFDHQGNLLPDNQRITKLGSFMRKASIDELPQLWNVLKGEMSLVGPRPLLVEYLPLYDEKQARRHLVKPGITGWAQINGRNSLSWSEKFDLDIWYVDHISLHLDTKILLLTIKNVLFRKGVNNSENVSMPKFTGNSDIGDGPNSPTD